MKLTRQLICLLAISGLMFGCNEDSSNNPKDDDCTLNGSCNHDINQMCGNIVCNIETVSAQYLSEMQSG